MRSKRPIRFQHRKSHWQPPRKRTGFPWGTARLVTLGLALTGLAGASGWQWLASEAPSAGQLACSSVRVIDGDTLDCDRRRMRLQGIDAPELAGHCRPGRQCAPGDGIASTESLKRLVGWNAVQCRPVDTDAYGRTVARCIAGGKDLSCAQLDTGQAIRRYGVIVC